MPALRVKMESLAPADWAGITGTSRHIDPTTFCSGSNRFGDRGDGGEGLKVPDRLMAMPGSASTLASCALMLSMLSPGITRHCTVAWALEGRAFSCTPAASMVATQVVCSMAL